jgi:phosphopantothenoylcysteine decarboxylase / phosphopantothenate---cysteine ligase
VANVVVGVTGGIAAYKSAPLIRLFSEAGHSVQVVATENAFKFIGRATLEALSKNPVSIVDPDLFTDVDQVKHIAIAKEADLIVVAPATASFIAKVAAGIADDLLTTTVLAATAPVVLAPAMHTEMWQAASTVQNIKTLESRNFSIVSPGVGRLTGEDTGIGRLAEPEEIFDTALSCLKGPLTGFKVCVTAGGTREPIDAVRFIGNYSSGKQGIAFAKAAKHLGAEVLVIAANIEQESLSGLDVVHVRTTSELRDALMEKAHNIDILVMAAAVADFSSQHPTSEKIKRSEIGETLSLTLTANPDLLKEFVEANRKNPNRVVTVGFAAEAGGDLESLGRAKLTSKGCDFIVANDVSGGAVFGSTDNSVLLISRESTSFHQGSKASVASAVMGVVASKVGKL